MKFKGIQKQKWFHAKTITDWDTAEGNDNIGWQIKDFVANEVTEKMKKVGIECNEFTLFFIPILSDKDDIHVKFVVSPENQGFLLVQLSCKDKFKDDLATMEIIEKLESLEEDKS